VSKVKIDGGWYDDDRHEYTTDAGVRVPSITQVIKLAGFSDFSGIDPAVLENAARRGTEVHALAAAYNQFGEVDPAWVSEECEPYFNSYMKFLAESGYKPDPQWTEVPIIANVCGMLIGVTPDSHGTLGRYKAVVELKCTASREPYWSIQTAIQECAIYKSNRCGRVRRHALILKKDGTYRLGEEYTDHENDMADGIAALRCVWWRINHGEKIWEKA